MNEFELIHRLTRSLPSNPTVVVGAGDDCAVLDAGAPDRLLLFKTDAIVEDVHFTAAAAPEKVGHKALGRCLSDIAAMAGTPTAALVTIGLPRDWGYSVGGETVIWRSALGLSADRRTLYYVAGPNLTLPILAKAVATTGAEFAMQLDINDYWVFFCTFYPAENDPARLEALALHQVMLYKNRDRYLSGFQRDFFYVTSANY